MRFFDNEITYNLRCGTAEMLPGTNTTKYGVNSITLEVQCYGM